MMATKAATAMASGRSGVRIARLKLAHFRSYSRLDLDIGVGELRPILLVGPNGAGKTNLLEALSFLAPGRGLRGARLEEVTRIGAPAPWAVHAEAIVDGLPLAVGTGLAAAPPPRAARDEEVGGPRRVVRIAGDAGAGPQALARHFSLLWLTPAMDGLFRDGAGARRRFFDRIAATLHPDHGRHLAAFESAMRERNRLLAERGAGADAAWLGALEGRMAEQAVAIAAARRETVAHLDAAIGGPGADPAFPRATVAVKGWLEEMLAAASALETEEAYCARLAAERPRDAASGRTGSGPHRSDFVVSHRDKEMPAALCSSGEQKALLIGLVLAHAALVGTLGSRPPMLLLDEVAAHLDGDRLAALLAHVAALESQVWMSGTDADLFRGRGAAVRIFGVADGRVEPLGS